MSTQLQNFYKATITRNWSATIGDFNVSVAPTVSSGYLVVSPNNSTLREIIYYTATGTNSYGAFITVSNLADRGVGGTSAQTHSIGESVRMNITAEHWQEMQDDITSIVAAGLPAGSDGQLMVNNGGVWGASEVLPESQLRVATVSVSSAEILALHTTPKQLIASPGAGKIIIVDEVIYSFTAGTQYANGEQLSVVYTGTTTYLTNHLASTVITSASNSVIKAIQVVGGDENTNWIFTPGINLGVDIMKTTTAYITGTGTLKVFIKYRIITL